MLDFCADRGASCDIELIAIEQINEAYERMLNLRFLVFRRLIAPMAFARPDATMDDDPARNEQCANERFQPIEHQHSARGPVADEPTQRRNGVEPKSDKQRPKTHRPSVMKRK